MGKPRQSLSHPYTPTGAGQLLEVLPALLLPSLHTRFPNHQLCDWLEDDLSDKRQTI